MPENKVRDEDYLFLTAMLRAREASMLGRDRMDRMLSAQSYGEAARLLSDCGYADMSAADARGVNEVLAARREAIFDEIGRMAPEPELANAFRLKYDYHNAKVMIKAEGAGVSGDYLLSDSGRVGCEALKQAYEADDFRYLPPVLGEATGEAKRTLARTGNPQLADFILDRACFSEMAEMAERIGSRFLADYTRVLIDGANLRAAVRTARMGRNQDFLMKALIPGGNVPPDKVALASASGGEGFAAAFYSSCLHEAAVLGDEAVKGGPMMQFELACDNAVTIFLSSADRISFGREPVVRYLALVEAEITAVRMILTGWLAGIAPNVTRERLRDSHA